MNSKTLNQRGLFWVRYMRRWNMLVFGIATILILSSLSPIALNSKAFEINVSKSKDLIDTLSEKLSGRTNNTIKERRVVKIAENVNLASILSKWETKGILPGFYVYTSFNGNIKRTKLILGLTKPIDVDDDGKNDIRVKLRIRPKVIFDPLPSFALSFKMDVNRLNDDIKYGELEVAGEVALPKILGGEKIRFGYLSEAGEEIPKSCSLSYLYIPHLFKLRKKPAGGIEFNPVSAEDSSIVTLATLENPVNDTETTVGIKYDPMVRSVISWERTRKLGQWKFSISRKFPKIKETTATLFLESDGVYAGLIIEKLSSASFELELRPFSKQGGYLHYVKENLKATDISLLVQTVNLTGTLSIRNLPSELEASWLLRPEGFVELNTQGGDTGEVEAVVKECCSLSFDPQTDLDVKISWSNLSKNGLNLDIDSNVRINIRDMYVYSYSYNESTETYDVSTLLENGNLELLGKFGLRSYLYIPEITRGIIQNSTIKIFVENASLDFTADELAGMGYAVVSLSNTGRACIDLLNFTVDNSTQLSEEELEQLPEDYLVQPWEYAPWMNGTVFIDTNGGKLDLELLDIESFSKFGHMVIKNLTGRGQTNIEFHMISMYLADPLIITNGPNTSIYLEQFSFYFFGVPITLYDAKLVEGVFNFYFLMWTDHWITLEIRDGSGIEHVGVAIEPIAMALPELDERDIQLHFYFPHSIPYLYFDWYVHDWLNASITGYPLHNSFVIDTNGIDTTLDLAFTVFNKFGIRSKNVTLSANDTNLTINFEGVDFSDPASIVEAISRTTLTGTLTLLSLGKTIEMMVNGTWYPIVQSGKGYAINVEQGHIQIVGEKRFIINETILIPDTNLSVTIAGDFSLGSEAGVIDIWFSSSSIRISGNVNFTVKDFYLAIGENFSMNADLFIFNLGTEAQGSIEIGPTPSGSGKITLTKANIVLRNCTIVYKGPIPIPNAKPGVAILSPSDGAEISDTVTITGNATDSDGYVVQVQVRIDDDPWQNATFSNETGEWNYDLDTTTLPNGVYRIEARSFDGIDYSDIAVINVIINNLGANWRPTVEIIYPSDGEKVNGTVEIQGTADDPNGDISLVQIQIDDGPWQNATGTTSWTFEWNTTGLIGKHTIRARSIDNEGEASAIESIEVTTKISLEAEGSITLSLIDASVDVENLVIEVEITGAVILADENPTARIELNRFSLGGVGNVSVELSPDGVGVETGGTGKGVSSELNMDLDVAVPTEEGDLIVDTDLYTYGRATGPLNFYYNSTGFMLGGDFGLNREIRVDINEISAVVNETPISVETHFNLQINTSAHGTVTIRWNETGLQSINADFDSEIEGYVRIYDVSIHAGDYGGSLNSIIIRGNGGLSVKGNTFSVKGELEEASIDNLYLRLPRQNISLSGGVSTSRHTNLSITVNSLTDFTFSSDGSFNVRNLYLSVETDNNTASVSLGRLELDSDSYLIFKYISNDMNITCRVSAHKIHAEDVTISYNNYSAHVNNLDFEGVVDYNLNSPIYVEQGDDYIKVVVGGKGQSNLYLDAKLDVNGKKLGLEGYIQLQNSNDNFTIYIGNLSGNVTLDIDGSAVVDIENFHLWYGDIIDVKIKSLSGGFSINTTKSEGRINLDVNDMQLKVNIDTSISIENENVTLRGEIDIDVQGGAEGNLSICWNEDGLKSIDANCDASVSMKTIVKNLYFQIGNLSVGADLLEIEGNGSLEITKSHLDAEGHLKTLKIENMHVSTNLENTSISGNISFQSNGYVHLQMTRFEQYRFLLTADGGVEIEDIIFRLLSNYGNATFSVRRIVVSTDGYVNFSYIQNELSTICWVNFSQVSIEDIFVSLGNFSGYSPGGGGSGTIKIVLSADLCIEKGDDWFKITLSDKSSGTIDINENFEVNGTFGGIRGLITFKNPDDKFVIYVKNLSGNVTADIDGSAVASIEDFHFWYGNIIDIDIPNLSFAFSLSTTQKEGSITIVGTTSVDVNANLSINRKNFTVQGHFSIEGGLEGNVTISWNESGITYIGGDVNGQTDIHLQMKNLVINYGNFSLSCDTLQINNSINLQIEVKDGSLHLYITSSGDITVYNLNIKVGVYEGSRATFGTVTFNGFIDVELHFANSTATMLSTKNSDTDSDSISKFLEDLIRWIWRW